MAQLKHLVVTGHLGFIGSAFCWNYRERYRLSGLDFAGWGSLACNLAPGVQDLRLDIADAGAVAAALDRLAPDAIINFAAQSHVDRSIKDDSHFWHSNVFGARTLALAAQQRGIRLVHVSTDEVYGEAAEDSAPWSEHSPIAPRNPYAVTKAAADMMLLSYRDIYDLDLVITRGANTIGPRQFPEKAIPKAVQCFVAGRSFPLYRTPARRMWIHVDDHVAGIEAALCRGQRGEVYNLAPSLDNEAYTEHIIERVRDIVGQGTIELVDDRQSYDLRYLMQADKAHRELGWAARYDLDETLQRTVQWYLAHPRWLEAAGSAMQARV